MEVELEKNNCEIEHCFYYELEELCQKITKKFCFESVENSRLFLAFAKDYTYFSPYFDFVIGVLGYSLVGPFFEDKKILWGSQKNRAFYQKIYLSYYDDYMPARYNGEYFHFSSNLDLQINLSSSKNNIYVDSKGIQMVPPKSKLELARQLLHLELIKNKKLCEEIRKQKISQTDEYEILSSYVSLQELNPTTKHLEFYIQFHDDVRTFKLVK